MLALIEHFLLSHNSCIVNIEFTKEDEELGTIKSLLDMMKINKTYWNVLKEKLELLSKHDIDSELLGNKLPSFLLLSLDGSLRPNDKKKRHSTSHCVFETSYVTSTGISWGSSCPTYYEGFVILRFQYLWRHFRRDREPYRIVGKSIHES